MTPASPRPAARQQTDRLIVITGGPGSGKSSLIEALRRRGHHCTDEAGRAIIRDQVASGGTLLPWMDPAGFAQAMLQHDLAAYRSAAQRSGPVFFDRGIPDVAGYLRLTGLEVPAAVEEASRACRYNRRVFVAPFWPEIYARDSERRQSADEAERTCAVMVETYGALGYDLEILPRAPVEERADLVLSRLSEPTGPG
ncbi:AAA family ATPase [Sphingosinicella sp. CPCC 101087]|uniref:AAA family ATPase n=1 Tax=Sphingosinicella sp. CPCC 101087 TaxID=2497754 RepID=UPI00101B7160|nr:AAA family ATPase [Sphingosinicella sp. CPCC 101087]